MEPFPQRLLRHQRGQLTDHFQVPPQGKQSVAPLLARPPPHLVQPCRGPRREGVVTDILQSVAAPERQRLVERPQPLESIELGLHELDGHGRLDQGLEAERIHVVDVHLEGVAARTGHDRLDSVTAAGRQGLAKVRDLDLKGVGGVPGLIIAPGQLHQRAGVDHLRGPYRQGSEQERGESRAGSRARPRHQPPGEARGPRTPRPRGY